MANGLTAILEKYGSVVLFDVETSGLNPYKDQIIELAAQKLYRKEDGLYRETSKLRRCFHTPAALYEHGFSI